LFGGGEQHGANYLALSCSSPVCGEPIIVLKGEEYEFF
jgi:hypothetical protein